MVSGPLYKVAVGNTSKWFGWSGITSRLKSNGRIQNECTTSLDVRLNRTVSCAGISSSGSWQLLSDPDAPEVPATWQLLPWPTWPFHMGPTSVTPCAEFFTGYCGYWNSQLHWNPVTSTISSGFADSEVILCSNRAVKKNS